MMLFQMRINTVEPAPSPFMRESGALDRRAEFQGNAPKIVQGILRRTMAFVNCHF